MDRFTRQHPGSVVFHSLAFLLYQGLGRGKPLEPRGICLDIRAGHSVQRNGVHGDSYVLFISEAVIPDKAKHSRGIAQLSAVYHGCNRLLLSEEGSNRLLLLPLRIGRALEQGLFCPLCHIVEPAIGLSTLWTPQFHG